MSKVYNVEVKLRKNEDSEHLIRRFLREVKKDGILKEVAKKEYHLTKSQRRKLKKSKSIGRKVAEQKKLQKNFERNKKLAEQETKVEKNNKNIVE